MCLHTPTCWNLDHFFLWLTWAYEKFLCAYIYAYQPVRIWTISCYNQLEFTQTSHRNTITSSSKLQQLPLWFKRHLMDYLPEITNYGTVWCVATIILCCFLQFVEVKVLNRKENSKDWLISLMPALWSSWVWNLFPEFISHSVRAASDFTEVDFI